MLTRRALLERIAAAGVGLAPWSLHAQNQRMTRIVVPYPAGGGLDAAARAIAPELSAGLGQNVIVENRPGGNGFIGISALVQSAPDGHTLLAHALGFAVNPAVYKTLPYNATRDIQPVAMLGYTPVFIAISPKLGPKTLEQFIAHAKKTQMKVKGATFGLGASQLMMESFRMQAGIDLTTIPYNGTAPAVLSVMSGDTDLVIMDSASVQQHIVAGSLRGLAVASASKAPGLPDLPTTKEAGMPGFVVDFWYGLFTRGGSPMDQVRKLNAEVNRGLTTPDVVKRLATLGIVPARSSAEEFTAYYLGEIERWKSVVKEAKLPLVE